MKPHLIDEAPWLLYPDFGCSSWPTCLECPFDVCVSTADKTRPSEQEYRTALTRAKVVECYRDGLRQRTIADTLGINLRVVEWGLRRYRDDIERARRKHQ